MEPIEDIRRRRLAEIVKTRFGGRSGVMADTVKRPRPNISQVLSGKRAFGEALARDIESILGLERFYLDHDTETKQPPQLINLSEHPDLSPVRRVRFKLAAGVHGYAVELDNGDAAPIFFRKDWLDLHNYQADKLVAFKVAGASMEPRLWDGDIVVVNLADTEPHDGEVFAVNYEGEPGIKRLRRDAGAWWLTSDNADQHRYAPKRCTEDVEILGRVIYKQSDHI